MAVDCPSSQIAVVTPSAVPLWKVIVGPRADELQTGPARVRFSFLGTRARVAPCGASAAQGCLRASPARLILGWFTRTLGKRQMAWTTPTLVEICIGLEINGYLPAEF